MTKKTSCKELAALMASEQLYALFDVRERGEYNIRQISGATSLPRSHIEFRIVALVPNKNVPIVLYDEGGERAERAARTLADLGYSNVSVLEGGLPAWERAGQSTASGVNVPSKAFGERVHKERNIPEITARELKSLQENAAGLLVLDVRTPEEYGRFCIPGGINVPGGDLVLWAEAFKQKLDATIVINCAGRTRSIIGAAALRRLGLTNVRALKNGTMGWVLAGLELESSPARMAAEAPPDSREKAVAAAMRIAREENIPSVDANALAQLNSGHDAGVSYLIDVRSEREYAAGHVPGSIPVPGGQAVQRADDFIAVRNGRIIFISSHVARAVMAAYWYRQMGYRNLYFLEGGIRAWLEGGRPLEIGARREEPARYDTAKKAARLLQPSEVDRLARSSSVLILDVGSSLDFAAAHLPGAQWISRGWLDLKLPEFVPDRTRAIVITCPDDRRSVLAARTLEEMGYTEVWVLDGGVRGWRSAGFATQNGPDFCLVEPNDVVLSPSLTGDKDAMRRYLEWEIRLEG